MLKVNSPYDFSLIKEIPLDGKEKVEAALQTAHELFSEQSNWLPAHERIAILKRAAQIMIAKKEELIKTATQEGGKPWIDSEIEVLRAINGVEIAAGHIENIKGEHIPMGLTKASENRMGFVFREPIGVVSAVCAFNHPLNLVVHQVATAVAVGCPVIIKPALTTPLSCLAFVEILYEAGLPKAWCQALVCENEMAELLVTDPRIAFFTFIGSAKVGWYLKSKLAPGTRCALEHGGVAPVIVEKDADVETLIPSLIKGGFYHAGQVCVSVQRIFIESSICEEVAKKIAQKASELKVGDPLSKETEVGPLILPREVDRVEEWVNEAIAGGAKVLTGGKRISECCFAPTVLLDPPIDAKVSTQEIFGPVVCIYPYENREDAIRLANAVDFHFQAAVFTKNIDIALECVKKLNATAVMVNDQTAFRVDWMPFGGRGKSGIGMGGMPYTMHEMTRE